MADSATTRNRLRKQSLGSNVTTSNYTVSDQAKQRVLLFTGSLSSSANVVVPSSEKHFIIYNASGANIVPKTSSGTGPTIPTGFYTTVYCDGSNVYSRPFFVNGAMQTSGAVTVGGKILNLTTGTLDSDAVNKGQMDTAIAASTSSSGKYLDNVFLFLTNLPSGVFA